jgi:hypothetical protein
MRNLSISIIFAAIVFVACNSNNTTTENTKKMVVVTDTSTVKYQCPMKCEGDTAYTTEGKCPVCEMDLVRL